MYVIFKGFIFNKMATTLKDIVLFLDEATANGLCKRTEGELCWEINYIGGGCLLSLLIPGVWAQNRNIDDVQKTVLKYALELDGNKYLDFSENMKTCGLPGLWEEVQKYFWRIPKESTDSKLLYNKYLYEGGWHLLVSNKASEWFKTNPLFIKKETIWEKLRRHQILVWISVFYDAMEWGVTVNPDFYQPIDK